MKPEGYKKWTRRAAATAALVALAFLGAGLFAVIVIGVAEAQSSPAQQSLAPRQAEAQRFLAQRGLRPGRRVMRRPASPQSRSKWAQANPTASTGSNAAATWTSLGPTAVQTSNFGLVTGRVSSIAFDPSDTTGNHLYIGTTGGGVWSAQNADTSTLSDVVFSPLTDVLPALTGAADVSISIGALTVQPGGTGVILAGTGDPNDALDSYYGAGILRSADGGVTWSLIPATKDEEDGLSTQDYSFAGEGFAGFAWSTVNPQLVVAAVAQAYEGTLVDADDPYASTAGLYYSADSGATWHLATIFDGASVVQGPLSPSLPSYSSSATAVVWNPLRQLFIAAVRNHGYYQSADGIHWARMAAQPGAGLTMAACPTNGSAVGSVSCPIFRGALAINPQTGDTFAWTVDVNNQDQGLWQDSCSLNGAACGNTAITFATHWNTAPLEEKTTLGASTIPNGNYDLALAAIPSQQDTLVFAGANDLWKCSLAAGCVWRNTTNSTTCMSAQVGEFQHVVTWPDLAWLSPSAAQQQGLEQEMFLGNDSGLWRSTDAVGETGAACNTDPSTGDASHFENMNGSLGSLAEVESLSPVPASPYSLMAGLGVNGTAGVKGTAATADWPQILGGYGGPVTIDPNNIWYVNGQPGVGIYRCTQSGSCTPQDFGSSPAVTDADVGGDGSSMPVPATFLVDPLDSSQLLIGTCRVWRGPANGSGWSASDAVSPILDSGATSVACNNDALIRSMDAMALSGGAEVVYVGMYGSAYSGTNIPGHVLRAIVNPASSNMPVWHDLTGNAVSNDTDAFNKYGFDISSIYIDPHDTTGNTLYVTVEGVQESREAVHPIYRSTNGGATWTDITANLPAAPANSIVVDPQNADTVYVATDNGVYFTTAAAACAQSLSNCWSAFGSGLPLAPVVALRASPAGASAAVLVAGTYGRGIWQTPLSTAGTALTTASVNPNSLTFPSQMYGTQSSAQTIALTNTGNLALGVTSISMSGDFGETDNCVNEPVATNSSCAIQVTFTPTATGSRTGQMTIFANVNGGEMIVNLSGTGAPAGQVTLNPATLSLGNAPVNTASSTYAVSVANTGSASVPISSTTITPPFAIVSNTCGATSLAANFTCQISVDFTPTQSGVVSGLLTMTDGAGTQTVVLSGSGQAAPTDTLNATSLSFPATPEGQLSAAMTVTITNSGDLPLTSVSVTPSAQFQAASNFVTQIAAHSAGIISVQFAPTQAGVVTGTLTITDALTTQTVALSGTGLQRGVITPTPASLTFATGQAGVAEMPQTITIANTGGAPIANIGFQISGDAAASFAIGATTCGALLAAGASCTVQIGYTPPTSGSITASLAISSSTAGVKAVAVPLNAPLMPSLSASPTLETFASPTGVGQSSAAQTIAVTNSGTAPISSVSLSTTGPFDIAQNGCTGSLAPAATCTVGVTFQPTVAGPATGTLVIASGQLTNPVTVTLAGTGFDFSINLTGLSTATVTSGQQADYTLIITPEAAQASFASSCGALPANTACFFNPATETLSTGVQGNVMVEVETGGPRAAMRADPPQAWPAIQLLSAFLLLPCAVWRRRKALLRILLLAILLPMLALGVSSCTSSGGGTGTISAGQISAGGATPAGTYTIPVTVSADGVSHSVNVTLTVD